MEKLDPQILEKINQLLQEYSLQGPELSVKNGPLVQKIAAKIAAQEKILFILPAFPAKSPSREKTQGDLPDLGEVLALKNLQQLCDQLYKLTAVPVKVAICSDGRVFSDLVKVSDETIDHYAEGIAAILHEYELQSIELFSMEDFYPHKTPTELRALLLETFAVSLADVKAKVIADPSYRQLFNGIHRFLQEDECTLNQHLSKNFIAKETKQRAYELLRRSDAWSNLLSAQWQQALRLSIHPHPLNQEKFGVKLVPCSHKWGTPWHNVVVKTAGRFELMHRKEALRLNAVLKMEREKYAYYEILSN